MTDNNSPNKPVSNDANNQNNNASKLRLNFNNSLGSGSSSSSSGKLGENSGVLKNSAETEAPSPSEKIKKSSSGELNLNVPQKSKKSNSSESAVALSLKKSSYVPPLPKDDEQSVIPSASTSNLTEKDTEAPTTQKQSSSAEIKEVATDVIQSATTASLPPIANRVTEHKSSNNLNQAEKIKVTEKNQEDKKGGSASDLSPILQGSENDSESATVRRLAPPLEVPSTKSEPQETAAQGNASRQAASTVGQKKVNAIKTETGALEQPQEKPLETKTDEESNSEASTPADTENGTLQDLLVGVVFLVFLASFLAWGANSLLTWKHDLDVQPSTSYSQICWSQNSESLAFIRDENKQLSKGQSVKSSLWVSDRFGDQVSCLQDSLPENYNLTGWFGSDSLLVLNSPNQPLNIEKFKQAANGKKASQDKAKNSAREETVQLAEVSKNEIYGASTDEKSSKNGLSFIEIQTKDNSARYFNLAIENAQVVGNSKDEVFVAQYLTSDKDRGQINLFSYKPGSKEAKVLVSVPSRQDEMMHVDSVVASPNNDKLAIVISVVASLSKSVSEDDDTPLGVWLFNRESKTLAWTTIAANNARDLSVVWSKDAKWLGGVARYADEAELFAFYGDNDCQAAKLRGVPQEGDIIPLITGKDHALTFVSLNRIDRYNFDLQQNTPMLSADNLEYVPSNFAVSSTGAVAYAATPYNTQNLYTCTLNNPNSNVVKVPADSAKHTWLYRAVGSLQYAVDYWRKIE